MGLGVIGAVPAGITHFHDLIHNWEIPIIITSGVVIVFGWALHQHASKMDCKSMGPDHEVCEPRKKTAAKVLKIATVLFIINVSVYFLVHQPTKQHNHDYDGAHSEESVSKQDAYSDDGHDH